jgi:hypothetical protein
MNHEVPQPMTATRSPDLGRTPASSGAAAAARSQQSGWLAISLVVCTSATFGLLAH